MSPDVVPERFESPRDAARFRRPVHRAGVELYEARIVDWAFAPHAHDAYGLGAIADGVERFRYRGVEHVACGGTLVAMNPDELHTGRAGHEAGWRYRMAYLDPAVIADLTGAAMPHFVRPARHDPAAARRALARLEALWRCDEPLAFDGLLADLCTGIVEAMAPRDARRAMRAAPPVIDASARWLGAVRDHVEAHLHEPLRLETLAAVAGLSPFHFLRSFHARVHATPHDYVAARRLHRAKRLLAAGAEPASVAAAVGLVDQSHLTRRFRRMYGTTPAAYQRQLGMRPARAPADRRRG